MSATPTPIAEGTDAGETIGNKFFSRDLLFDTAGADAMGLVTASPAIYTLLGRLKAITDALTAATYYPATQPVSGNVGVTGSVAVTGTFFQATQPVSVTTLPLPTGAATASGVASVVTTLGTPMQQTGGVVGITGTVAVTGTFWQTTQPVSIAAPVAVTGTFFQATQPISAAALPLPAGAATSTNQAAAIAAIATIGTRAYGNPAARVTVGSATAYSAAITATEVLLHASTRCFILPVAATGTPTVDTSAIPLEAGEKFHMRITTGQRIGVTRDTADGFLNIVPVA